MKLLGASIFFAILLSSCAPAPTAGPAESVSPGLVKVQSGRASWYGSAFQGSPTANGERFNMYALTAAHPTLPFNTKVTVRSLTSKKTVTVRINDRGPFTGGRIIDLSYEAARRIGIVQLGVDNVQLEM